MTTLPYGLRDVKLRPRTGNTLGTPIDLPNSRTFSYEESEDFETLRGDDKNVASRGSGPTVEWELEAGGISLEAYVAMNGGSLVISGTGAGIIRTYSKKVTDARPEFHAEGQSISESGGDFHVVLPRCKATGSLSGELADATFLLTSASGEAYGDENDLAYQLVENATITAIAEA